MVKRIVLFFILMFVLVACNMPEIRTGKETEAAPVEKINKAPLENTTVVNPSTALPTPAVNPTAVQENKNQAGTGRFTVQPGTPSGVRNFVEPEAGCNYAGVAGQVFGRDKAPVIGLIVEVGGKINGKAVLFTALTGSSPTLGPGGFDIALSDQLLDAKSELFLQLFDLEGVTRSSLIPLNMTADCEKNLLLINFVEVSYQGDIFFPLLLGNSAVRR